MTTMPGRHAFREEDLEVRQLEPSEWTILRDLRLEALNDSPAAFESTVEEEAKLQEADWLLRIGRRAVAFVAGRPVGLVGWSPPHDNDPNTELIGMWVRSDVRGTRAAPRLVEFVRDVARGRGGALDLAVRADNTRANRFYEKVGFVATGSELGRRSREALVWMRFVGT